MLFLSLQETNISEESLVTVVKRGLPTTADLHVLLSMNHPKRKRTVSNDKVRRQTSVNLESNHLVYSKLFIDIVQPLLFD